MGSTLTTLTTLTTLEYDGPIAIITNNRPEKHNAANDEEKARVSRAMTNPTESASRVITAAKVGAPETDVGREKA